MPQFSQSILRPLWERAQEAEIGISIATNDPTALRHELLTARAEWPDAHEFADIMTFCPSGTEEVYMVKKSVELPDA